MHVDGPVPELPKDDDSVAVTVMVVAKQYVFCRMTLQMMAMKGGLRTGLLMRIRMRMRILIIM